MSEILQQKKKQKKKEVNEKGQIVENLCKFCESVRDVRIFSKRAAHCVQ